MTLPSPADVAPVSRRVVAYVIDAAIGVGVSLLIPIGVLGAFVATNGSTTLALVIAGPLFGVLGLAWTVVYTAMQAGSGSIGMRAQGLRLGRARDGARIGFWLALLRNLVWGLAAAFVVGYFTVLFDDAGRLQGWHDKVAGAVMLDARTTPDRRVDAPGVGEAHPSEPFAGEAGRTAPQTSMPGFAQPPARTAMPGFQPPTAAGAPQTARHAPTTDAVDEELFEHTVMAGQIPPSLSEDPLISFVPGITQEPAPRRDEPAAPAPDEPAPVIHPPASHEAPRGLVFTWDDGQRTTVNDRASFGRDPEARDGATSVPVRDETRSLSKTHFEAGSAPEGSWVVDRHSTNGTTLVRDGVRMPCPPGERVPVRPGDALEIGDRSVRIDRHE